MQTLLRSQLKSAPYNPRTIDRYARKKLVHALQKYGLVEPIVYNERTGHVVGGHQRLSALDEIHDGKDFSLDVSVIDVDEKTEREINILLNNPGVQGTWDLEALAHLLEGGVDIASVGFDKVELESLFWGTPFYVEGMAPLTQSSGETETILEGIGEVVEKKALAEEAKRREIEAIKAAKKETQLKDREEDRADCFFTIVFNTVEERDFFNASIGCPPGRAVVTYEFFQSHYPVPPGTK